jgi:DNA-binding NtrC family response regulator
MSAEDLANMVKKAHGGTLLLANVDALDPELHPLVMDLLDRERGLRSSSGANVRLIASAEPDLSPMASDGDLFGRLCRVSLFLPPLRERRSDIPLLIRHLLDKYASENDGPARRVPDDTQVLLWQYDWPGNLRELKEVVRQSADAAADGLVRPSLLPAHIRWSFRNGTAVNRLGDGVQKPPIPGTLDDERETSILR